MARGPKKHLKRLNAPKHWMLDKLGGIWAPRPSQGPHKLRECMPLSIILRNRLKYALTRRETVMIVMRRLVAVNHKIRTDLNFPAGFMDLVSVPKTNDYYRLLYDVKGRFVLHNLKKHPKEHNYILCKVKKVGVAKKASIGSNPFRTGKAASVPYIITTDGRTIRYPDPDIQMHDTIKYNLATKTIDQVSKFEIGNLSYVIRGKNVGRIGVISRIEKHPGAFDVVHVTEIAKKGREPHTFSTRLGNVFVIGKGTKSWISLPKGSGIRLNVFEERDARLKKDNRRD